MNHQGPITCPFHLKGRRDADNNSNIKPYNCVDTKEEYESYVKGYAMYKAMKDSLKNTISNTEDWPEFAKKDYNNRINRYQKLNIKL